MANLPSPSFLSSVETALGPRWVEPTMRRATGRVVESAPARLSGPAASSAARSGGAAKAIAPLALALEGLKAISLATDENSRRQAEESYVQLAETNPIAQALIGGLGGVNTIYGAGEALTGMFKSMSDAGSAEKALAEREAAPETKRTMERVSERRQRLSEVPQEIIDELSMSLPKEEWKKVREMPAEDMIAYAESLKAQPEAEAEAEPTADEAMLNRSRKYRLQQADKQADKQAERENMLNRSQEYLLQQADKQAERENMLNRSQEYLLQQADKQESSAPEPDEGTLNSLFKTAHGTDFDPKSSMDQRKMQEIKDLLSKQGGMSGMTPNQFALKLYREYKYV